MGRTLDPRIAARLREQEAQRQSATGESPRPPASPAPSPGEGVDIRLYPDPPRPRRTRHGLRMWAWIWFAYWSLIAVVSLIAAAMLYETMGPVLPLGYVAGLAIGSAFMALWGLDLHRAGAEHLETLREIADSLRELRR